jgi:5-methylcytosine-specific restriction endonuclease McrA
MSKSQIRKERKRKRFKQKKINTKLKKKLFGHLFMAPCIYCRRAFLLSTLTVEHITPLCLGGTNDPSNIALACFPCNNDKGREAWFQKREFNKKHYEQYHSQYRIENWERII